MQSLFRSAILYPPRQAPAKLRIGVRGIAVQRCEQKRSQFAALRFFERHR